MVTVVFPPQFQRMLNGALEQLGAGSSLSEVLTNICEKKPELRKVLFLPSGEVSPFVAFSVRGGGDLFPSNGSVPLRPGDSIEVILAMAGG